MSNKKNQVICSDVCREKRYGRYSVKNNIATGTVGAISELMVASDLMINGYSVFRAVSQSCFCDLIALRGKEVRQIEVRTGYLSVTGNISYPKKINKINGVPNEFAVYVQEKEKVYYFPI